MITADNITDEDLASIRDDGSVPMDDRIRAAAALDPHLPRSHGIKVRCRERCAAILNARAASGGGK